MKKAAILILILVAGFGLYTVFKKTPGPARPQVAGMSTSVLQQFTNVGTKAGFHVYAPTALPAGFSLSQTAPIAFLDNVVDYSIPNASGTQEFIIAEKSHTQTNNSLMLTPFMMQSAGWNVTNVTINGATGSLGQTVAGSDAPKNFEDLVYTTSDGVDVEIFDNFGYGQLVQLAQSMQ